jgi:hypothetical protein
MFRACLLIVATIFAATISSVSVAQTTDVDTAENDTQDLSGRLLADGTLYTGLRWNLGQEYDRSRFIFRSDVAWYEFYGSGVQVIRRPFENLLVQGNGATTDLFFVAADDPTDPGIQPPYDVSIRTLTINDATLTLFEDVQTNPIDLRFRSVIPGEPKEASITLNNGAFDALFRQVTADADMDLLFHSQSGQNQLLNMAYDPVGRSLSYQVDPGSELTISMANVTETRYRSPASVTVDAATLNVRGSGAKLNLELNSDGVNGLKVINNGTMNLGGTGFSDRFEFVSQLPQNGIQILDSSLNLAPVTTLEGYLLLDGAEVSVGASGRLSGGELDVKGTTKITSAGGQPHQYGNLQGIGDGSLTLVGGQYEFNSLFLLVGVGLTLGEPGAAVDTYVVAKAAGGIPALLNKGLNGIGTFEVSNVVTRARFPSGSTLAPGHSIGELGFKGRASFESGSTLAMEIDAAKLALNDSGAHDQLIMQAAVFGQANLLDVQAGAQMTVSIANDQVLPPGTRAELVSFPDSSAWNGVSFAGFPHNSVVVLGQNHWRVDYNDTLSEGLPVRLLTLTVVDPIASVDPTHLDFAPQEVQTLSPLQVVTVTNVGGEDLTVSGFNLFGEAFTVSGQTCVGTTLAPGAACELTVRFFPPSVGDFSGAITIESNSFFSPPGLTLFGVGIEPAAEAIASLSPTSITFPDQVVGKLGPTASVVLTNTGTDTLTVTGYQFSSSAFVIRNDGCIAVPVQPGASCQFEVGFLPTSTGSFTDTLVVQSNSTIPATLGLAGEGTEPEGPLTIRVSKTYSDGNNVEVGVSLSCNGGLPLEQQAVIAPGKPVSFVVDSLPEEGVTCTVAETSGAENYTPEFFNGTGFSDESCVYERVQPGGSYVCDITNYADSARYVATKAWELDGADEALAEEVVLSIYCSNPIANGVLVGDEWHVNGLVKDGESLLAIVDMRTGSASCRAEETVLQTGVEVDNGCTTTEVTAGDTVECTITNILFFEGIPALNPAGVAALLISLLSFGMLALRRQV